MKKIVLLSATSGNPRIRRRMETFVSYGFDATYVFWSRDHGFGSKNEKETSGKRIRIQASNIRNPVKRFLETKNVSKITYKHLKKLKPEIVYVFHAECLFAANRYCKETNSKLILEISDLPAQWYLKKYPILGKLMLFFVNRLISDVDAIVFTSPYFYTEYYKNKINLPEKNVFVFENVPKKKVFENFEKVASQKLRIGFVGGVRYLKSLETLIRAIQGVKGLEVIIAGAGPQLGKLEKLKKNADNIHVIGGFDYEKDIKDIYSNIDIVYSVYDTSMLNVRLALPNKLYEAIICEAPIIVARGTCLEKYVKELDVGFSVPYGDEKALRELLKFLLEQPGVIKKVSMKEKRIKNEYFYENIEPQFLEWIEDVLGKPKA